MPHSCPQGRERGGGAAVAQAPGTGIWARQPEGGPFQDASWWAGSSRVWVSGGGREGRWSGGFGPVSPRTKASPPASPGVGPADKWATASLINLWSGV